MLQTLCITRIENTFQHLLHFKNSYKVQNSITFYVENSVIDDRLDMKISYMNRAICCLHNYMFPIA